MDILIKRKNYDEMFDFLNEKTPDSDWKFLLENLIINEELLEHLKNYLNNLNCIFKLNLFFLKIFTSTANLKNKIYHKIVYDIIISFLSSNNKYSSQEKIRNLLLIQTVKISLLDNAENEKLNDLLTSGHIYEEWFIEMLINMGMYSQIGTYYEAIQDYEKSLFFYEKAENKEKAENIRKIIFPALGININLPEGFEEVEFKDNILNNSL
jgi:tetratricopeptide (TPR) repeat protein